MTMPSAVTTAASPFSVSASIYVQIMILAVTLVLMAARTSCRARARGAISARWRIPRRVVAPSTCGSSYAERVLRVLARLAAAGLLLALHGLRTGCGPHLRLKAIAIMAIGGMGDMRQWWAASSSASSNRSPSNSASASSATRLGGDDPAPHRRRVSSAAAFTPRMCARDDRLHLHGRQHPVGVGVCRSLTGNLLYPRLHGHRLLRRQDHDDALRRSAAAAIPPRWRSRPCWRDLRLPALRIEASISSSSR